MRLWGGRFAHHDRDSQFENFSESFSLDQRWVLYDLRVNRAYVKALGEAKVLRAGEVRELLRGLGAIRRRIERHPDWAQGESSEDVHTWVEARLARQAGSIAQKLRTGRSRNDLVATEARLYTKDAAVELERAAIELLHALHHLARKHRDAVMPGYTHLQPAQPILFAHYLLAYFEMFSRDCDRLEDCREWADEMPMGAGSLAGASFPINRVRLARELGFARVSQNSVDATSDRDFACELLFACALTLVHLSRLAEDLVIFSSPAFGFVEPADAYSTGSSLMPQKRNPDAMELIRGKAARVLGRLAGMLALLKGLPMAYNRDLQEDKAALFDGVDTARDSLRLAARVVETLRVHPDRMKPAMARGFITATDLADELVRRGIPFAEAHRQVGTLVRRCAERGKTLADLTEVEAHQCIPSWDRALRAIAAAPEKNIRRKHVLGGTAPRQVQRQIRRAEAAMARRERLLRRNQK
ncbi:MAG: argininosuccinate lyase [Terriglobia bacterium]|jgi:argininosuccinate lyase